LPGGCADTAWHSPGCISDIAGFCPDNGSDVAGNLPGVYRDNAGIFHRQLGEYFADIPPDVARKFRRLMSGHSVAIRRIFGGYGRLVETRGEASTLKFIQIV
jgi:hypothetical protein